MTATAILRHSSALPDPRRARGKHRAPRPLLGRVLVLVAAVAAVVGCSAPPAQASGWVANSCAVEQALRAVMQGPHPATGNGQAMRYIPCGEGASGIKKVNAGPDTPYYVDPEGPDAPWCMEAGQWYYPNGNGAKITPTVRCVGAP